MFPAFSYSRKRKACCWESGLFTQQCLLPLLDLVSDMVIIAIPSLTFQARTLLMYLKIAVFQEGENQTLNMKEDRKCNEKIQSKDIWVLQLTTLNLFPLGVHSLLCYYFYIWTAYNQWNDE